MSLKDVPNGFRDITVAVITVSLAHAINAHYRAQLERSGSTEMNVRKTCDLHKTKAQKAAHASTAPAQKLFNKEQVYRQCVGESETILVMKGIAAEEYLVERGWRQTSTPGE